MLEDNGRAVLCDFGAAFCFDLTGAAFWQAMECRAFGLLVADIASHTCRDGGDGSSSGCRAGQGGAGVAGVLHSLAVRCLAEDVAARPPFAVVERQLAAAMLLSLIHL